MPASAGARSAGCVDEIEAPTGADSVLHPDNTISPIVDINTPAKIPSRITRLLVIGFRCLVENNRESCGMRNSEDQMEVGGSQVGLRPDRYARDKKIEAVCAEQQPKSLWTWARLN